MLMALDVVITPLPIAAPPQGRSAYTVKSKILPGEKAQVVSTLNRRQIWRLAVPGDNTVPGNPLDGYCAWVLRSNNRLVAVPELAITCQLPDPLGYSASKAPDITNPVGRLMPNLVFVRLAACALLIVNRY